MSDAKKKTSIRKLKQKLMDSMADLDQTSAEYKAMNAELERLTHSEQNERSWMAQFGLGCVQTVISSAASIVQICTIMKHEDRGNVLTTKSMGFVERPKK